MNPPTRVSLQVDVLGIAQVRLIRTDKRNALDGAMFDALIATAQSLQHRQDVRVVVLAGEGAGFCAGIDMGVLADMKAGHIAGTHDLRVRTHGTANRFQYAARAWRELPMPVIAAVHGFALGGGLELALGADLRYCTPDAQMSIMEVVWGLVPDMGGTLHFHELMRDDLVRELAYTGRIFQGMEALSYGLVTRVGTEPLEMAQATAQEIARRSPDAVRALKRLLNRRLQAPVADALLAECEEQQRLLGTPNQIETVLAAQQKRPPVFSNAIGSNPLIGDNA